MPTLLTCCRHVPPIPDGTIVINVCPGCDRRYRMEYPTPRTISLWEVVASDPAFTFPHYDGARMTILDACPTRDQDRIHMAMRTLAGKMRIELVEPAWTKRNATCCGDAFHGAIPTARVIDLMQTKAAQMPLDEIVVYCVSCIQAMHVGHRRPQYMLDLLFGEATAPKPLGPDAWHAELDEFIEEHKDFETTT